MLTKIKGKYLKEIYLMSESNNGIGVRSSDIANKLKVRRSTSFKMIENLAELEYIKKNEEALIYLTPKGVSEAKELVKRFDVIKSFLQVHLCFSEESATNEANNLEDVLSKEMLEKMEYCSLYRRVGIKDGNSALGIDNTHKAKS